MKSNDIYFPVIFVIALTSQLEFKGVLKWNCTITDYFLDNPWKADSPKYRYHICNMELQIMCFGQLISVSIQMYL